MANTEIEAGRKAKAHLVKALANGAEHLATLSGAEMAKQGRALKDFAGAGVPLLGWGGDAGSARISIFGGQVAIVEQPRGDVEQA